MDGLTETNRDKQTARRKMNKRGLKNKVFVLKKTNI